MDRLVTPGRRKGQGRPSALEVLWLQQSWEHNTKELHQAVKPLLGAREKHGTRQGVRRWVHETGYFDEVFRLERPRLPDEDSEPEEVP